MTAKQVAMIRKYEKEIEPMLRKLYHEPEPTRPRSFTVVPGKNGNIVKRLKKGE